VPIPVGGLISIFLSRVGAYLSCGGVGDHTMALVEFFYYSFISLPNKDTKSKK